MRQWRLSFVVETDFATIGVRRALVVQCVPRCEFVPPTGSDTIYYLLMMYVDDQTTLHHLGGYSSQLQVLAASRRIVVRKMQRQRSGLSSTGWGAAMRMLSWLQSTFLWKTTTWFFLCLRIPERIDWMNRSISILIDWWMKDKIKVVEWKEPPKLGRSLALLDREMGRRTLDLKHLKRRRDCPFLKFQIPSPTTANQNAREPEKSTWHSGSNFRQKVH